MKKIILFFLLISNIAVAQNLKPTDDEAIIKLTLTNNEGKALQTTVFFKTKTKEYSFNTNTKGYAEFIVKVGLTYKIKASKSLTYYDYEITDFAGQVLDLSLKFDTSEDLQDAATNEQALFILSAFNLPKGKKIELLDEKTKSSLAKSTQDTLKTVLPINKRYRVKVEGYTIKNDIITVDKTTYNVLYYVLYISSSNNATLIKANNKAFLNVIYTNIHSKNVVPNEVIEVKSKNAKKTYKGKTNKNGTYLFIVPKNDTYFINISHVKNIITTKIGTEKSLSLYDCNILYPNTKELLENRKNDSIRIAKRESEYKKIAKEWTDFNKKILKAEINAEAKIAKEKLKKDPKYFEKAKNTVCAVMFRVRKKWNTKMIVTDLTGSMYPYMKQLLLWHTLKMITDDKNEYVFFNDGDQKSDSEKVIGNTGGIYYTNSNNNEIVIDKILETMSKGSGGDSPENDLEALIYAQRKNKSSTELILIADNYSSVKDISLLTQLKVPVRIILCGTDWGIHPDYIEIAYKTKGSLHTIEQDIMKLEKMTNGKTLKIGKYSFVYSNGKFFKKRK